MQIEELRTLVTLAHVKNFTKTAQIRMMSQPTVSLHIKNLEQEFETELFHRTRRSLKITTAGQQLVQRAQQMIALYDETHQELVNLQKQTEGILRIGASQVIAEYILPVLIHDMKLSHPNMSYHIYVQNDDNLIEQLSLQQIDLAFVESELPTKTLNAIPFMKDEKILVVSTDHHLASVNEMWWSDLNGEDWLTTEYGSNLRNELMKLLHKEKIQFRSMLSINHMSTLKQCVLDGLGIALIPRKFVQKELSEQCIRELPIKSLNLHHTLSYVIQDSTNNPNVTALLTTLQNRWKTD